MKLLILAAMLMASQAFAQFTNESQYALLQTGGNSQVQTQNAKTTNAYKWDMNQVGFGGHYTYGESSETVSARNWDVNSKYERELNKHLSIVGGEVIEGNRFTGIKTRYNTDIGAKHYFLRDDVQILFTELSYRYSIEDRYSPIENVYDNKGRSYNEYSHKYSETVQYKVWLEYVPNFTDGKDYLVNGEASVTTILTSVFSLKVAYLGNYDNLPATSDLKNYDYATTTALVAKF